MAYWSSNYWQANYWQANYWAVANVGASGSYWNTAFWNTNFWHPNFWAGDLNVIQINVPAVATRVLSPQTPAIDISLTVSPPTATRTLTGLTADAANDVTVSATLETLTLTGINTTADPGEYYEGDVNITLLASSAFSWTDGVPCTLATKTLSGINPAVTGGTGDVSVQVTSTPAKTLTPFVSTATNPVVVQPLTPSLTLTEFNVTTGFGTLVNAQAATRTLTPRQTNVTGTNADLNEFEATTGTLSLVANNPGVVGDSVAQARGGHFIPGLAGISAGKRRDVDEVRREAKKAARKTVRRVLKDDTDKPVQRVSRKKKDQIVEETAEALRDIVVGDVTAIDRAAMVLANEQLTERRQALREDKPFVPDSDEELTAIAMALFESEDEQLERLARSIFAASGPV